MRKKLTLILLATFAVLGATSAAPAPAQAKPDLPVEVKRDSCGRTNVYVNGQPLLDYTQGWCGPDTH